MKRGFTPSLVVSPHTHLRLPRRLPLPGQVLPEKGESVTADQVVARAARPGRLSIVHATSRLGLDPADLDKVLRVQVGDSVEEGDLLAEVVGLWGLFRGQCKSPVTGQIEYASNTTGHVGIRTPPESIEVRAFIDGVIQERLGKEGVIVQGLGALIQGIYGLGGERRGILCLADKTSLEEWHEEKERILVFPKGLDDRDLPRLLGATHVAALLVAGLCSATLKILRDPKQWAHAVFPPTVILTDGFGELHMDHRILRILEDLMGHIASVDGTTQIRAGVVRPQVFVSRPTPAQGNERVPSRPAGSLSVGCKVRILAPPDFAVQGTVVELPEEPRLIETGSFVRVATVKLDPNRIRVVPRANLEVLADASG